MCHVTASLDLWQEREKHMNKQQRDTRDTRTHTQTEGMVEKGWEREGRRKELWNVGTTEGRRERRPFDPDSLLASFIHSFASFLPLDRLDMHAGSSSIHCHAFEFASHQ